MEHAKLTLRNPLNPRGEEPLVVEARVEIGSTAFALPASALGALRLPAISETRFRAVQLEINGNRGVFQATIVPDGSQALIGSSVLAALEAP